jgi:hypothetical protein
MNKILDKTDRLLRLRNYSLKTRKAYLLYIRDYITFSKKKKTKEKQKAIEDFFLISIPKSNLRKQLILHLML